MAKTVGAKALHEMMAEAERLERLTTRELVTEASDKLPLLGPDCLLADEIVKRLRRLAAWEIRMERHRRKLSLTA